MRHLLTELRAVETELRDARTPSSPASRTRRARLEAAIRDRSRLLVGSHDAITPHFDLRAAKRALDRRVLVEYAELDGNLYALTLARGKLALAELGREQTRDELEWLLFDLARAAHTGRDDAPDAARALETRLLAPLLPMLGNAPLVIVPTGALYGIPWAALPSLRGRSVVVAPSAATWTNLAARTPSRARRSAFIAGPRLRHAAAEVRAAAKLRKGATVLTGTAANADATLAAIDGAKLAHIACHGRFRADSPLFSSLELADGPLNVHELQRLRRAPETVVLSACDLAVSELHPGDELLGLAAALLGLGTRTVVASVVPVPDAAAKRLMLDFHRRLAGGATAAAALAAAQERAPVPGFLCLGSG